MKLRNLLASIVLLAAACGASSVETSPDASSNTVPIEVAPNVTMMADNPVQAIPRALTQSFSPPSSWNGAPVEAYFGRQVNPAGPLVNAVLYKNANTGACNFINLGSAQITSFIEVRGSESDDFMHLGGGGWVQDVVCSGFTYKIDAPNMANNVGPSLIGLGGNNFFNCARVGASRSTTVDAVCAASNGNNVFYMYGISTALPGSGADRIRSLNVFVQVSSGGGDDCIQADEVNGNPLIDTANVNCGAGSDKVSFFGSFPGCETRDPAGCGL